MASPSRFVMALCLCLACVASPVRSGEAGAPPELSIGPALEYRFETRPGAVYELQCSRDGETWEKVAGPFFGHGEPVEGFLRGEAAARRLFRYRVQELDPASIGPAPEKLRKQTLVFNDEGEPRQFVFFDAERGMLKTDAFHARSFTAEQRRVAPDRLEVNLTYHDGSRARLELRFLDGRLGTARWRQTGVSGEPEFSDVGPFSLHPGRLPETSGAVSLPEDLTGKSLLFASGSQSTRLEFTSPREVTVYQAGADPVVLPYVYELESFKSGMLQLERPDGALVEYALDLKGPASGSFLKSENPAGGEGPAPAPLSSDGNFNLSTEPEQPVNPNCPPPDLAGHSFYLAGSDPVTLMFNADGSGNALRRANGSVEVTPFTYSYTRSGRTSASLTLTFPGAVNDLIEDYTLNFNEDCGGSYERSEFEGGQFTNRNGGLFDQSLSLRSKLRVSLAW